MMLKPDINYNRVCVVVPTYNNALTLAEVLRNLLAYTEHIIVVNDGSTDETLAILQQFPGIKCISYEKNRGKGYALRTAFHAATKDGYEYAITIDSDGQHFAKDLPAFFAKLNAHPDSVIIGARNMDQTSVPGKSSFGNKFSNFWFRFETGLALSDTQSGYRLYPLREVDGLKLITPKYEFEIEILVRLAWRGVPVVEVPVGVYYPEPDLRVSHFRPFIDFSRISVLNTVLVIVTLVYIKPRDLIRAIKGKSIRHHFRDVFFSRNEKDSVKAMSIALGVFMGIVPVWGFQLVIAIALAIMLKLNKALVILAANISIPPMIPVILFLSHIVGAIWMGDHATAIAFDRSITLDVLKQSFQQYVLGAFTLAILAGLTFGSLSFGVLKIVNRRPQ